VFTARYALSPYIKQIIFAFKELIKNKKERTCMMIDVAVPADRKVTQKEAENRLKYKRPCVEIQWMWNMKCVIMPMVIGAIGMVTKRATKNLEAIPGYHSVDWLQKTAVLGTSHIIRKVLQSETWYLSDGDQRCCHRRSTREKGSVKRGNNNNNNKQMCSDRQYMSYEWARGQIKYIVVRVSRLSARPSCKGRLKAR
jgi:hypothetical protein